MSKSGSAMGIAQPAPIHVPTGWVYVVRPPAWPLVTTPAERGGVRLTSAAPFVHIVAVAEPNIDRIFFLGGRSSTGASVDCSLTVESIDAPGVTPHSVVVGEGWYVERKRDPLTASPPKLSSLRYDILPDTHPIRIFLANLQPGSSGTGGIGGGGGNGGGAVG